MSGKQSHLIRNIPPELWRKIKVLAAQRGQTIQELVVAALEQAVTKAAMEEYEA